MPTVKQGDKEVHIGSWGGFVEQQIREAQARGDFDNLPGAGKPLQLEPDNPFNPEWSSAFRVAKNAGAAPLWVELDKDVGERAEALDALLGRTARYLDEQSRRIRTQAGDGPEIHQAQVPPERARRRWWRWWRAGHTGGAVRAAPVAGVAAEPRTLADLEAERQRARDFYLGQAAELDAAIKEFNAQRPRNLIWIEKPRLLPDAAARRFDERCPPIPAA